MQLLINQIGKIQQARVNINGLTVIAGKNDTGKSTVGKVLYALFRSLEMGDSFFNYMKKTEVLNEYIRPLCRQYIALSSGNNNLKQTLADLLKTSDVILTQDNDNSKLSQLTLSQLLDLVKKIHDSFSGDIPKDIATNILKSQQGITAIQLASNEEKMSYTFSRTFDVMFNGTILNSKYKQPGTCEITQEKNQVLKADISSDKIMVRSNPVLTQSIFRDVVYIESPFVLERVQSRGKPHWNELKTMLHQHALPQAWNTQTGNKKILDFIQTTVLRNARVSYNEDWNDFVYQVDEQSEKLTMANVACGVKSFTLLFLLLKLNVWNKETLLVVDEPENHLHPEFQIKYAQLIALLVEEGFSVVLTSHSPTFIQAVSLFARKQNLQDKVSFYLATNSQKENYSILENVTDDLEQIYSNLITPTDMLFEFTSQGDNI